MIKRLLYIFLVLMMASLPLFARGICSHGPCTIKLSVNLAEVPDNLSGADTTKAKKVDADDKKKIKEIPTAKRQAKPEKLVIAPVDTLKSKVKTPRQRRPDGLVRPPEIPRRNNN